MSKALVLYFSVYGSTRWVAAEIAKQTGADLTEIEPAVPYESDYDALIRRAQRELERDLRPAIREPLRIDDYDLIFLGYPIWCFTVPMILRTFLEQYDLTGKTVVPFNTHVLADAKIPLYLFIGENDDYYGSDSVKETYAALAKLNREKG